MALMVALLAALALLLAAAAREPPDAHALACPSPPKSIEDFLTRMDLYMGCEWPRGEQADEAIKAVRKSLLDRRSSFRSSSARLWLDRTVEKLNVALQAGNWGSSDVLRNNDAGSSAMRALRIAMGRLYWVDTTLRNGTGYERTGIAATMWYIAAGRFNVVWQAGGDDQKLWQAEVHMRAGNADFVAGGISTSGGVRIRSTLRYETAWKRLLGQPPA